MIERRSVRVFKGGFVDYEGLAKSARRRLTHGAEDSKIWKTRFIMNRLQQFGRGRSGEGIHDGRSYKKS